MGIDFKGLLVIAVVVILLFGTKKLRTLGSDLGAALKGFKKAMSDDDKLEDNSKKDADFDSKVLSEQKESELDSSTSMPSAKTETEKERDK